MNIRSNGWKWPVILLGAMVVVYSVVVLAYVSSSPDLRLRFLLSDADADRSLPGVVIRDNTGMEYKGEKPEVGNRLIRIGKSDDSHPDDRIETFLDFSRNVFNLRNEKLPPGGWVYQGADPTEDSESDWLVEYAHDGSRWVHVEFLRDDPEDVHKAYVLVQSLPLGEVLLSFVWFILQLGVFAFAAVAYWNRPLDRTSRMFFVMCILTLGAYVGGYHWWVLGGRLWLKLPFSICAILVPAVVLHFFLIFPRPKSFFARNPALSLVGVYGLPVLATMVATWVQIDLDFLSAKRTAESIALVHERLDLFRQAIYGYLLLAAGYFLLTLSAVIHSLQVTRNPMERGQLRWILGAGVIAAICVADAMYYVIFDRESFALGAARVPMFLASLSFMLAYTVGILRYRLMLLDQIAGKGFLYYLLSSAMTVAFALAVALGSLAPEILNISLSQQQALTISVVLLFAVVLLLWMRDMFQQEIDRQFFREKYQLDEALERVNRAVAHPTDPELLAEMMLSSCREVLNVDQAAVYLLASSRNTFKLAACHGDATVPLQITLDADLLGELQDHRSLQRVPAGSRSAQSPFQNLLRQFQSDLVHTLESGRDVVGVVFLGRKQNSASFTAEDLTFLNALGQITNVALHSAKVDRDIARLNEDLRLKTERISEQKRQIALLQSDVTATQLVPTTGTSPSTDLKGLQRNVIKGNSPALRDVLQTVAKVAVTKASVLIRGESGTGKELLAQVLHENSPRRDGPFIRVHCAALSDALLESELFGHVKGAFTGAHVDRAGRFELADGGTLFLDEIGDIPLDTQVKLLRVLQERQFEPVGGNKTISVDVRLITATHQPLEELIRRGSFREDLYYRLNVVDLTLPPLRERRDDIYELALHFVNDAAERMGKRISYIDDEALAALEYYTWPGNIRELENVIERAVVLSEDGRITLQNLTDDVIHNRAPNLTPDNASRVRHGVHPTNGPRKPLPYFNETTADQPGGDSGPSPVSHNGGEKEELLRALTESEGNKAEAARKLGLPRSTYFSKLKKHGIR